MKIVSILLFCYCWSSAVNGKKDNVYFSVNEVLKIPNKVSELIFKGHSVSTLNEEPIGLFSNLKVLAISSENLRAIQNSIAVFDSLD